MNVRPKQSAGAPKPSGKAVLVIDDEITSRELIKRGLGKFGYTVLTAGSGEEGLKIAQESDPDVIIIDVLMPGMDGFMLLKEIRRNKTTQGKKVVVLTSRENVGETFLRSGADGFLTKPVDPEQLNAKLEKLAGR